MYEYMSLKSRNLDVDTWKLLFHVDSGTCTREERGAVSEFHVCVSSALSCSPQDLVYKISAIAEIFIFSSHLIQIQLILTFVVSCIRGRTLLFALLIDACTRKAHSLSSVYRLRSAFVCGGMWCVYRHGVNGSKGH
jgi:hypothetical protein